MRHIVVLFAVFLCGSAHARAEDVVIELRRCEPIASEDGTIITHADMWPLKDAKHHCVAPMPVAVEDGYLGFRCPTWRYFPMPCIKIEPTRLPNAARDIKRCFAKTSTNMVIEWSQRRVCNFIPNRIPHRVYKFDVGQVCISPYLACISREDLGEQGQQRFDAVAEMFKKRYLGQ